MSFLLHLENYQIGEKLFTLFQPDQESIVADYRKGKIAFPYWSQVWPAAYGLAQFILRHPHFIAGKKVLELAAGLGLPSLVAATTGAATVVTSDYVVDAVEAMQCTKNHHQLNNLTISLLDWNDLPDNLETDVLLLSDVSYDETLFTQQEKIIRSFIQKGTTVIITTPQRLMAKQAIQPLLSFCRHQEEITITQPQRITTISLFVLEA